MKRVLIIDDEKDIGTLMTVILRFINYNVEYASNAVDAVKKLEKEQFDIVFLDLNLGTSNGLSLIPSIREKQKDCKIIVISAYGEPSTRQRVEENGVKQFIQKPFKRQEIIEAVNKAS